MLHRDGSQFWKSCACTAHCVTLDGRPRSRGEPNAYLSDPSSMLSASGYRQIGVIAEPECVALLSNLAWVDLARTPHIITPKDDLSEPMPSKGEHADCRPRIAINCTQT
jgi:hypothetical protein